MQFSLKGKVALVTGGSRGIGRATAIGFAQAGADVIVVSRKLPELVQVSDEIGRIGTRSMAVSANVGKMDDIRDLVEKVEREFGRIDILVNNAATSPTLASMTDVDERLWDAIMNLNLKGLFFLSQAIAKIMMRHGGGRIINVASVDAFRPEPKIGVYSISKAGVISATKVMALELAEHNIRVNALVPGNTHTRLGDSRFLADISYHEGMERTPMKRIAEPEEMVGAMVYLASDASSFVTGTAMFVDGGYLIA